MFSWTIFLATKDESFDKFLVYAKSIQNTLGTHFVNIRSDYGTEFKNTKFLSYCEEHGIGHNFSARRIPQYNIVVERKNRTLQEMAKTMLTASGLPRNLRAETINTTCYI